MQQGWKTCSSCRTL